MKIFLTAVAFFVLACSVWIPEVSAEWFEWYQSLAVMHFSVCDFCGSFIVCRAYRKALGSHVPWVQSLAACCGGQFGGTTLVGLLLGQPASWVVSHNAARSLLLAWWLTFCCPYDAWNRFCEVAAHLVAALTMGAWLSTGHAMTSWGADKAINAQHEVARTAVFATVIAGAVGASGGTLLASIFDKRFDGDFSGLRKAIVGSVLYYIFRDPHGVLLGEKNPFSPLVAKLIIGNYSVAASLLPLLDHAKYSPQHLIETSVCFLLNIPSYVDANPRCSSSESQSSSSESKATTGATTGVRPQAAVSARTRSKTPRKDKYG